MLAIPSPVLTCERDKALMKAVLLGELLELLGMHEQIDQVNKSKPGLTDPRGDRLITDRTGQLMTWGVP